VSAGVVLVLSVLPACEGELARNILSDRRTEPTPETLTQTYASKNGLITVRYPASFAAKTVGESAIVLARNLPDGTGETLAFTSVENPISDELAEFARVANAASIKALNHYAEKTSRPATCNGRAGLEVVGTWGSRSGQGTFWRRACFFLRNGHGYAFTYSLGEDKVTAEDALLLRIREATQFNR
jgi:hypothetical protein